MGYVDYHVSAPSWSSVAVAPSLFPGKERTFTRFHSQGASLDVIPRLLTLNVLPANSIGGLRIPVPWDWEKMLDNRFRLAVTFAP